MEDKLQGLEKLRPCSTFWSWCFVVVSPWQIQKLCKIASKQTEDAKAVPSVSKVSVTN